MKQHSNTHAHSTTSTRAPPQRAQKHCAPEAAAGAGRTAPAALRQCELLSGLHHAQIVDEQQAVMIMLKN